MRENKEYFFVENKGYDFAAFPQKAYVIVLTNNDVNVQEFTISMIGNFSKENINYIYDAITIGELEY